MQTSSPAFFSMMTTMPLRSWCEIISRACEVCSANSSGSDVSLADDLAQETFLRAYKNLRSFRGEARFSTWLYRIAYNCFREEARKRKELVGIDEAQLEAEHDPQTVDPALRYDLATPSNLLPSARAHREFCFAARMVYRMMKQRVFWRFRLAL